MSDRSYPRFHIPNRGRPVFSAQTPLRPNWPHPPPPRPHTMNGAFPPPYPLPRYHTTNMMNRLARPLKPTYPMFQGRNSDSHFPAQSHHDHTTRKDATSRRKTDMNTLSTPTYTKPNRKALKAPSDVIVLDGADNASGVCAQARSQQGDLIELGSNKNAKQKTSVIVDNSQKQKQSKSSPRELQLSPSPPPVVVDLESVPVQLSPPQIVKESVQQPTGQRIPVQDCHHQGGLTDQAALQTAVHQEGIKEESLTQRDTQQVVFKQENVQQKISKQETSKQQIPSRESRSQQHLIVESTQQQPLEKGSPQEQPPEKGDSQQQPPEKGDPQQLSDKGSPQQLNYCKEQHQNTSHDFPTQKPVSVSEESHPHDSPIEGTRPQVNSIEGTRPHDSPVEGTHPQVNSIENTHPQVNPVTGTHPKDCLLKGIHPKDTPSEHAHPQDTPLESTHTQVSSSPGPHLQYPPETHGQQGLVEDGCQREAVPRQEQLLENGKGMAHLGASLERPDQQPMTNVVEELPFEQTYYQITPNNTEQPEELSPHEVSFKEVVQQERPLLEETSQPSVPHHKTSDSFGPVVNVVGPHSPVPDLLFQPDPCQQVSHEETTTSKIVPPTPVPSLAGDWHSTTSPQQLLPVAQDTPYGNTEPVVTTLLEESSIPAGCRQSVISMPVVKKETQNEFMKSPRISPSGSAASSDSDLSLDLDSVDEDFISGNVCNHGDPKRPKNGCSFKSLAVCPKCFVIAKVDGNLRQPIQLFEENRVLYAHTIVQGPSSSPKQLLKRIDKSGLKRAHEEIKNHQRVGIQEESSPAFKCRTILSIPACESLLPAYQLNTQELVNGLDDSQRSISPAVSFDTSGTKEKFDTYSISSQDNDDDYSSDASTDMDYHSSAPLEGSGLTSFSAGHIRGASRRGWSTLLLDELGAGLDQQKLELLQEFSPGDVSVWKKLKTKKSTGESPLHNACSRGNVDMARYFMFIEGVSPDIQDNAGWAPLHEACSHRQHAVANLLLESGASTSVCARDGTMPIHDAVEAGDLVMVKTLVHYGADITPDSGERYPVDIAKSKKHDAIVEYLQSLTEKFIATSRLESTQCLSDFQIDRQPSVSREVTVPQTGTVKFGPELDYRQFYCSPFFDESASPVPVAYNLQVPVMHSPTCHNFYTFDELIKSSGMSEEDLRRLLKEANIITCRMEAKEFREQVKLSRVNAVPVCMRNCYKDIELVPDCSVMRDLLQIKRINLENLF